MDTASVADPTLAPDPRTSRRLFQLGAAGLGIGLIWLVHRSQHEDMLLIAMGSIVMVLAAFPALTWARKGYAHFPVFEMFMLTGVPFYAVPLLSGRSDVLVFSGTATWEAAWSTVLFQLCAIAAFTATKGESSRSEHLTVSLLPENTLRYAQTGIWLNTAYLYVNGFTQLIPGELYTVFRAVFFGIGTVSLFIESRRWGAGQLTSGAKFVVSLNLVAQITFLFRDLYLIAGVSVLLLALIGYVSSSRRIPMAVLATALPLVAVLHNGKSQMRAEYWGQQAPLPSLADVPDFYARWFEFGLQPPSEAEEGPKSTTLAGRLFERASLFQMLCLVTERTPEFDPFLFGESYKYIPAQLIPTFLWPDKPSSLLSNVLLAIHYRLVSADNPSSVSIAFGMIAEAYANFGLLGCIVLGLLLGYGYKRVSLSALGCPQFSALGLLTILLAAWSFQVEQIFATWLVSLFQAAVVVIGLPLMFRILFHQE